MRAVDVAIPEVPQAPYPIFCSEFNEVINGFGRGSSELGIPTANIDIDKLPSIINDDLSLGVYFGYCQLMENDALNINNNGTETSSNIKFREDGSEVIYNYGAQLNASNGDLEKLPVVLSVGKNPFYNNEQDVDAIQKTVELHILHDFESDFYGALIKFNILGYIRPELNYTSKEQLIDDINTDIEIARSTLLKPTYLKYKDLL
ncbi:hypothetical protein TPHA_0C01940 [Tetrapisispora phaffii CBS 4417]|uniref:Riboflavin kinase n=1 Tax=Tetrapisispora phaffii (strain ATCC 24235 / CBS 4417 / NBRC 1672 / NRRL Y-8282 / UCD 70-5) TaxID=1071381 RepID=G8BRH3_TETPH|nr:hypothetical protein TPHA_0C01940 [Tetrapisispora phaffii CBS 4417]CCE62349.1 hypothetical protein TPHA_0C01940 [Tetrapisispora phaffii CBS 4417]